MRSRFLAGVPDEERRNIATFAEEHSVPDGDQVVARGDFADRISIIEEGTAEVRREGRLLDSPGPGDVFGEIVVLERRLRDAAVVATSPLRLITLTQWDMKRFRRPPSGCASSLTVARRPQG